MFPPFAELRSNNCEIKCCNRLSSLKSRIFHTNQKLVILLVHRTWAYRKWLGCQKTYIYSNSAHVPHSQNDICMYYWICTRVHYCTIGDRAHWADTCLEWLVVISCVEYSGFNMWRYCGPPWEMANYANYCDSIRQFSFPMTSFIEVSLQWHCSGPVPAICLGTVAWLMVSSIQWPTVGCKAKVAQALVL